MANKSSVCPLMIHLNRFISLLVTVASEKNIANLDIKNNKKRP